MYAILKHIYFSFYHHHINGSFILVFHANLKYLAYLVVRRKPFIEFLYFHSWFIRFSRQFSFYKPRTYRNQSKYLIQMTKSIISFLIFFSFFNDLLIKKKNLSKLTHLDDQILHISLDFFRLSLPFQFYKPTTYRFHSKLPHSENRIIPISLIFSFFHVLFSL